MLESMGKKQKMDPKAAAMAAAGRRKMQAECSSKKRGCGCAGKCKACKLAASMGNR